MVSLSEGFDEVPIILFERPSPGRGAGALLVTAVGLGLFTSFWSNF
jgi:hypothetical protein